MPFQFSTTRVIVTHLSLPTQRFHRRVEVFSKK
ncbi:hypothetical protein NC652_014739 [Populus alba x Populus x berolinensis]|uniref:Uncharacterized protein n=1 Tax=Populus alba x Populus x berolinensis TaxID=444605 RepID=A0AAD6QY80_9ROSI|nr:hypothetical protein NC651_014290 [Populus alba x Populus x berolinensis]KAJ6931331.1 hypothetical protein NC652_014739 [Populus alba x Populus x berolinensis]KAJ6998122.1 hypothetical protein NC653_014347 [Populus alba x Populus x berolinensis]